MTRSDGRSRRCVSQGSTRDEALANVQEAISLAGQPVRLAPCSAEERRLIRRAPGDREPGRRNRGGRERSA